MSQNHVCRCAICQREMGWFGLPTSAGQPLGFTHWTKDPMVPYTGCKCSTCEQARIYRQEPSDSSDAPQEGQQP